MHEPNPDTTFVPGAAKRNLVGLRAEEDLTAVEKFGLPIALNFGAEMNGP